jgi:hypothetical protein
MRNSSNFDSLEKRGENGVWAGGKYSESLLPLLRPVKMAGETGAWLESAMQTIRKLLYGKDLRRVGFHWHPNCIIMGHKEMRAGLAGDFFANQTIHSIFLRLSRKVLHLLEGVRRMPRFTVANNGEVQS